MPKSGGRANIQVADRTPIGVSNDYIGKLNHDGEGMQVGQDFGMPNNDLVKQYDGKYIYKFTNGKLDIDHYNDNFNQYSENRQEEMKKVMAEKLEELNKPKPVELIYDLSVGEIAVNTKDAMYNIIDDVVNLRFTGDLITRDHRMFYLGIVLIIIACLLFFYMIFGSGDGEKHIKYESSVKID